jgi:hypothetical protein
MCIVNQLAAAKPNGHECGEERLKIMGMINRCIFAIGEPEIGEARNEDLKEMSRSPPDLAESGGMETGKELPPPGGQKPGGCRADARGAISGKLRIRWPRPVITRIENGDIVPGIDYGS